MENAKTVRRERLHVPTGDTCNNRCIFCMEHPRKTGMIPDSETVLLQLEANKQSGDVIFTAGEPTLNPNLQKHIRAARDMGFNIICLVTNGKKLADRDYCVSLLECGLNDITISIHGHNAEIHDVLTGVKGSFDQTQNAIMNLHELRDFYEFDFYLSTVLNKINLPYLMEMMLTFFSLNIDMATFKTPRVQGRSEINFTQVVVPMPEVAKQFCSAIQKFYIFSESIAAKFFNLNGPPYCLMQGYEIFLGVDEIVLGLHAYGTETTRVESMVETLKRDECKLCVYDPICPGVEKGYIDHFGWEDFIPRTEYLTNPKNFLKIPGLNIRDSYRRRNLSLDERRKISQEIKRLRSGLSATQGLSRLKKAEIAHSIGLNYYLLGENRLALLFFTHASKWAPRFGIAHIRRAQAWLELKDNNNARQALSDAEGCSLEGAAKEEFNKVKDNLEKIQALAI